VTVYVDDALIPAKVGTLQSRWSHLIADTPDELHAFAARLGLRREWFQDHQPFWHYDLTEGKRRQALALGAEPISWREAPQVFRRDSDTVAERAAGSRLLVTGSRAWTDENTIRRELTARFAPDVILVSGACPRGADAICERIWQEFGGRVERHPAEWRKYGRGAGFRRNSYMARLGARECLAFIQDSSSGASHAADVAQTAGIPVRRQHPSAEDMDYRAGLAWRAGDLDRAADLIRQARLCHPERGDLWARRDSRIQAEIDRREARLRLAGAHEADTDAAGMEAP